VLKHRVIALEIEPQAKRSATRRRTQFLHDSARCTSTVRGLMPNSFGDLAVVLAIGDAFKNLHSRPSDAATRREFLAIARFLHNARSLVQCGRHGIEADSAFVDRFQGSRPAPSRKAVRAVLDVPCAVITMSAGPGVCGATGAAVRGHRFPAAATSSNAHAGRW